MTPLPHAHSAPPLPLGQVVCCALGSVQGCFVLPGEQHPLRGGECSWHDLRSLPLQLRAGTGSRLQRQAPVLDSVSWAGIRWVLATTQTPYEKLVLCLHHKLGRALTVPLQGLGPYHWAGNTHP